MMEKEYYTADEAMKLLGKAKTTFYKEVEEGIIPSVIEKGRKRGRKFPKEAVDTHVKLQQHANEVPRTFIKATNADLWTAIEYDRELYGEEDIISYRRALEWRNINADIFMMLKEGPELAGTTTFIPLDENVILALLNDKIRERNIPDWAIRSWNEAALSVYIPTISIFPTESRVKNAGRGRSLLCYTLRWAISLNRLYDIKSWYAMATTKEGLHLVQELGFKRVAGAREGYILENIESMMPIIKNILKRLETAEEWAIVLPGQKPTKTSVIKR